jgi:ABC-type dipeptide/oligopeptide/nickel transport system permease subunit
MDIDDRIQEMMREAASALQKQSVDKAFVKLDRREVVKMSDKDLAKWQAEYPADSPQFILAQYEWNRRLSVRQIRAAHITAWIGVIGTLVGVVLGWWLGTRLRAH